MDAPVLRMAHRLARAGDVGGDRAGEPGDGGALRAPGDLGDGLEIPVRRDGEARLDDVDAHPVEEFGNRQLLVEGHGCAGALLAVAQRRVEDDDAVLRGGVRHGSVLAVGALDLVRSGAGKACIRVGAASPESPGAHARTALRGG